MFDIGFSELLLIAVITLLVVGPDKLPAVARTAGLWWGRIRYTLQSAKNDFDREIGASEIRRQLHNEQVMKELGESQEAIDRVMKESEALAHNIQPLASQQLADKKDCDK
jgi:Tat protein translocase TatB subunit